MRLLACCFLSLLLLVAAPTALRAAENTQLVGVLDLEVVLNGANTIAARKAVIQKDGQEAKARLEAAERNQKELRDKLELLGRSSPDYAATSEELELAKVRYKQLLDRTRAQFEKAQAELLATAAAEVRVALKSYCIEKGIQVVMLANNQPIGGGSLQETQLQLGMQSVLYAAEGSDITAAFLAWYNARPAAGQ
jgi:Skp family chaperone for outer membrane proteins